MDKQYVQIPGIRNHELPPLLVKTSPPEVDFDKILGTACKLVDEDIITPAFLRGTRAEMEYLSDERTRRALGTKVLEDYQNFLRHWQLGYDIMEWARQCVTTFETRVDLYQLLDSNLWPHVGYSCFVELLADKQTLNLPEQELRISVGYRLMFLEEPKLRYFRVNFLQELSSTLGLVMYEKWAVENRSTTVNALPPHRFYFDVADMNSNSF